MQKALPSEILLVLGMHRSGTSALTRTLNILGLSVPNTLIKNNSSNVKGHWESLPLSQLNDEYLRLGGLVWSDWRLGNLDRIRAKNRREFQSDLKALLSAEFPADRPAVLKEPRIVRIADEYLEFFKTEEIPVNAIIPVRNPLEVIQSLVTRNDMDRLDAALLWLRNVLEAVDASADVKRVFFTYDRFLQSPVEVLSSVAARLGFEFPIALSVVENDIADFISHGLRHHEFETVDVAHDPITQYWINDVYLALRLLCNDPLNEMALQTLSRIKSEFDSADPVLEAITQSFVKKERDLRTEQEKQSKLLIDARETTKQHLDKSEANLISIRGELGSVRQALQISESERASLKEELTSIYDKLQAIDIERNSLQEDLAKAFEKISATESEYTLVKDELNSTRDKLQAIDIERNSLQEELAKVLEKISATEREYALIKDELNSTYDKLQASETDNFLLREELQSANEKLETSSVELDSLHAELGAAHDKCDSARQLSEDLSKSLAEHRRKFELLELETSRLKNELNVLRGVIDVFRTSTSWRITAPVRGVAKFIRYISP
ncbi:MAG: hypothetical protein NXH88_09865 [Hyphomonas sp.]|nr:hypothetical protein [Hyphomonas sp.]